MSEAIDLLVRFAEAYDYSQRSNDDPKGELRESTQMLLAILTNEIARPADVEAVFPHDERILDD